MRVKSVSMVADSTGRRYAWPANYYELTDISTLSEAVAVLHSVGYSLVRRYGSRAILRKRNEFRYICEL